MKNQDNERLQQVINAWAQLPEAARVAIHALATSLLDATDYKAVGQAVNMLTRKSPGANTTTG